MSFRSALLALLPLAQLTNADFLEPRQASSAFNPFHSCVDCFRSSWTHGSECVTNTDLLKTMSRILNPPAQATSAYEPFRWCSNYLRQTEVVAIRVNTTAVATRTSVAYSEPIVTVTDRSQPTQTVLCPIPSIGMQCGWNSNSIDPARQGLDRSVFAEGIGTAEQCHQACLQRPSCKAYRWQATLGQPCSLFTVGIGPNAINLIRPTPSGTQWWDRNCPVDLPIGCTGRYPLGNGTAGHGVGPSGTQPLVVPALIITPGPLSPSGKVSTSTTKLTVRSNVPVQSMPRLPVVSIPLSLPHPPVLSGVSRPPSISGAPSSPSGLPKPPISGLSRPAVSPILPSGKAGPSVVSVRPVPLGSANTPFPAVPGTLRPSLLPGKSSVSPPVVPRPPISVLPQSAINSTPPGVKVAPPGVPVRSISFGPINTPFPGVIGIPRPDVASLPRPVAPVIPVVNGPPLAPGPILSTSRALNAPLVATTRPFPSILAPNAPLPTLPPRPTRGPLEKRFVPFPPYFSDLNYLWSSIWVTPACSCIITSVLPPLASSTTSVITRYNGTVVVTSTTVNPFTVTVTPRVSTVYSRVN